MLKDRKQDNSVAYIYALEFPEGYIRYIGKTMDPEMRYKKHLRDAKYSTKSHRLAWINSLLKQGQKPIFSIIDVVPESEWVFWEKHYISLYSSWGFELTNGTLGGEGVVATMEVKQRISISCKKYWSCHDNWIKGKAGTLEASQVGRKKGAKLSDELIQKYCANFAKYYENHEVWNKGKVFRKPDLFHKEKPMKDPKNRVVQLNLDGSFVREWGSASAAGHILGLSPIYIRQCCFKHRSNYMGFIWLKKMDYDRR